MRAPVVGVLQVGRGAPDAVEILIGEVIDDLLATGGTARAAAALIEELGGQIEEVAFVIELAFLNGRGALDGYPVHALMAY